MAYRDCIVTLKGSIMVHRSIFAQEHVAQEHNCIESVHLAYSQEMWSSRKSLSGHWLLKTESPRFPL